MGLFRPLGILAGAQETGDCVVTEPKARDDVQSKFC